MSKLTLDIEPDYDFEIIGISCHNKDYRLCFELNKLLEINLSKLNDHNGLLQSGEIVKVPLFTYVDTEKRLNFAVLGNRSIGLVPLFAEHKSWDYFMIIQGALDFFSIDKLIEEIKKIPVVLACKHLDINTFKNKENLVVEW